MPPKLLFLAKIRIKSFFGWSVASHPTGDLMAPPNPSAVLGKGLGPRERGKERKNERKEGGREKGRSIGRKEKGEGVKGRGREGKMKREGEGEGGGG